MIAAAAILRSFGCQAALIKGGHLKGDPVDVLSFEQTILRLPAPRVPTQQTHGTGCTYAAAITALLASGERLPVAVTQARQYLQAAIESAPGLGRGNGPLNHFAKIRPAE